MQALNEKEPRAVSRIHVLVFVLSANVMHLWVGIKANDVIQKIEKTLNNTHTNNPSRCRRVIYILVQQLQPDGHQKICTFCLSPKPGDSPSNCKRYATLLFIVGRCNLYLYVLIPNKRQILLFFF